MIIQCDQCNTKFKLDDSKVPDKGIKVRCAKCKQVFMVQKETATEEPDLDFLLSGLGTQAPDAGKEQPQTGASASPATEWEGFQPSAPGPDIFGEAASEPPAGGISEEAQRDELSGDIFPAKEEPVVPEEKSPVYGEFSFEEEGAKTPSEEAAIPASAPGEIGEFEFGEFPFEEQSTTQTNTASAMTDVATEKTRFDFEASDFSTGESPLAKDAEDLAGVATEKTEDGTFTFGEEEEMPRSDDQAIEAKPESLVEAGESFDFREFVPQPEEGSVAESSMLIAADEKKHTASVAPDFGDIDFGEAGVAEPEVPKEGGAKAEFDFSHEMGDKISPTPSFAAPASFEETVTTPSFAASDSVPETTVAPSFASKMPPAEDELPPLAISTRTKGHSFFSIAVTAIVALIVVAIVGIGFYVLSSKEGPAVFNRLGLSSLAKWAGMDVPEEGGITIKNPQGAFLMNKEAGEIFVISGEAVNNFKNPRASIQVRGVVVGPKGEKLMQKTAYCGNVLSKEQLATLPMAKIEEAMESPFGDSLANLGVQPGKGIPFVIVFSGVQKNASEFSVEVVGSTLAGQ